MEADPPSSRSRRPAAPVLLAVVAVLALAAVAFRLRRPLLMAAPLCTAGRWDVCLGSINGVAFLTMAALPLAAGAVCVLALRRAGQGPGAWRRSLAEVALVYGTLPWVWITMQPGSGAGVVPPRVSLVPLRDLATMTTPGIIGNLLVLAAVGFFAPLRFAALRSVPRILVLAAGCSLLIEVAQYALRLDRVSSVDDVLLNTVGAGLAGLASRPWWPVRDDAPPAASTLRSPSSAEAPRPPASHRQAAGRD